MSFPRSGMSEGPKRSLTVAAPILRPYA
jgi:hypothetical protein